MPHSAIFRVRAAGLSRFCHAGAICCQGMKKQSLILLVIAVAGCVVLGAAAALALDLRNPFGPPPRVEIRLGDDWQAIRANSDYAFHDWDKSPKRYATDYRSLTYAYADPQHRLEFPDTRGLYFEFENGRVSEIRVMTYGPNAPWQEMSQRVRALTAEMERAGWKQSKGQSIDVLLERARAYYANPTFENMMNQFALGRWQTEGAMADLELYRVHHRGETVQNKTLTENEYSLNIHLLGGQ